MITYMCDWCSTVSTTQAEADAHADRCLYNPRRDACKGCAKDGACRKPLDGRVAFCSQREER